MTTPPERIYNWMNTQMSIARHYGCIKYNGHEYTIAMNEDGQPLVRDDVLKREAKAEKEAAKARRAEEKQRAAQAQEGLI